MDKVEARTLIAERLAQVEGRIRAACARAGRERSEVSLVAVTKMVPAELAALLPELGVLHLGENRPQELWKKAAALPRSVHWHLIGHLQRNKIEATLPLVDMIHSVDSERLLHALVAEADKQERLVRVLMEVNVSGEASKHGFTPEEAVRLAPIMRTCRRVQVVGLMTMAPLQSAERCRPIFAALRELRDRIRQEATEPHVMRQLSMGMSSDFEIAIEEGATLVRLGTVLFEGLGQ